ncbi:MAG: Mur ligase domain-containing protein [Saprospiraceae bacterium]
MKQQKIHFIAIGGAAMHNLALDLASQGHIVTGSDDEIYEPSLGRLKDAGIAPIKFGWYPQKITKDLDAVILGMHAKDENPELVRALDLGIKVFSYPEYIFHHSINKKRIVIAGSHGKTTTTAMILHVLSHLHWDFDYLVGAQLQGFDRMVKVSNAPLIVMEGDEYLK